jgi:hypothetical protein
MSRKYIAERKLLASRKGSEKRLDVTIRITEPFIVQQGDAGFPADGVAAGCRIAIDGIDVPEITVYGMDSLQAVNLASNIESLLQERLSKYDFFWATGEPYFEE